MKEKEHEKWKVNKILRYERKRNIKQWTRFK